ncbi:MAG TPA: helicase-related protein, partial [Planctomycetaceae bacterium]
MAALLDLWRRSRILYVPDGPIFSSYHRKDDPFIQQGLLPLGDFRPMGLALSDDSNRFARSLIGKRQTAVQALMKKWAAEPDKTDPDAATSALWSLLAETKILVPVVLQSHTERPLAGAVHQVNAEKLSVEPSDVRVRCTTCQRVTARRSPNGACTRHNCRGVTVTEKPDRNKYDVWLMGQPFVMVSAEEHTAQVPGEERNRIENEFKSKHGRTNCLVATPTLEMGVNIGALDMALMRNVPPKTSNYWQRAGRAGREERMAVVVTYCRRSPHDRYFFDDPLRLLGGAIEAPSFNLRNPLMVAKHVRSAILSELLLRSRRSDAEAGRIAEALGELFPTFVRGYLLDDEDRFRDTPMSAAPLGVLLDDLRPDLAERLERLFARHWPDEAKELASREAIEAAIAGAAGALDEVLRRLHRRLTWARTTRSDLHRKKDAGLIEKDEEQLLRRCDEFINSIVRADRATYTLSVLAAEGFLPG